MEFIHATQSILDENADKIPQGLYIDLCKITKDAFKGVEVRELTNDGCVRERQVDRLTGIYRYLDKYVYCGIYHKIRFHALLLKYDQTVYDYLGMKNLFRNNPTLWGIILEQLDRIRDTNPNDDVEEDDDDDDDDDENRYRNIVRGSYMNLPDDIRNTVCDKFCFQTELVSKGEEDGWCMAGKFYYGYWNWFNIFNQVRVDTGIVSVDRLKFHTQLDGSMSSSILRGVV
jgi:hypothetical protein